MVVSTAAVGGIPEGTRLLALPDAAEKAGIVVTRLFDMLRNKQLIAVRIQDVRYIPEAFFNESGEVNKFVPGAIALLSDGGYNNQEILDYLFTDDDSLPGRPVDALHGHLAREVMRRAQAMAL
ncbi:MULTISPECIES: Rv2175c family DNA-binding protein [Corynebacterium]|uniref:Rv2175c family DNA-binding protein n=1 Tax=Corynebacterium TaxID=1716 RepID=UPI001CE49C04|nr:MULTISPECIES: Rv2175c family DNA-binding protein [Corynebacterium]